MARSGPHRGLFAGALKMLSRAELLQPIPGQRSPLNHRLQPGGQGRGCYKERIGTNEIVLADLQCATRELFTRRS